MNAETVSLDQAFRQPGAILLVSCYELGHQPLGIASPLSFLERAGIRPDALDISVERFDLEKAKRARFVSISVPMHTALRLGVRVAERVREINPRCHICFYGLYASLNADYLLKHCADSVIGGEFEESLVALVESLASGAIGAVEGVTHRDKQVDPVLRRLHFPIPSRGLLPPLGEYAHLERNGSREMVGYVEASRGCLHRCLHCPITPVYDGRFFVVPKDIVLEDIRRLVSAGARHITFGDADFLNGPRHSLGIVRAMHGEFPELTFDFTAKVEHILKHRSVFPELARYGCVFMVSAFESLSDQVLLNLEKGHTRADIYAALDIVRQAGIPLRPSFVPFTPWATLHNYLEMFEFVESEGLIDQVDPVQYTIRLLVPPRSSLLSRPEIHAYLGPLVEGKFTYEWTHPDPRMDQLYRNVGWLVEQAAGRHEDPALTFQRVREAAYEIHGERPHRARGAPLPEVLERAPRLTEAWFC